MAQQVLTLEALIDLALNKTGGNDAFCDLEPVRPELAKRIEQITNLDVTGFKHSVGESSLRHVLNRHGDPKIELTRGQLPIKPEDFLLLPQVFAAPDEVFIGDDPNVIQLCKRLGNELWVLQEARTGRKKLALLSMWKRPLPAPVAPHRGASTAEASAGESL